MTDPLGGVGLSGHVARAKRDKKAGEIRDLVGVTKRFLGSTSIGSMRGDAAVHLDVGSCDESGSKAVGPDVSVGPLQRQRARWERSQN